MRYVDAGYVIALGALALYAVVLLLRHRRLERAAARRTAAPGLAAEHGSVRADDASGASARGVRR